MDMNEEIQEARVDMGEYASEMTDEEIKEILYQLKTMATFVVDFIHNE
ncbi:hypothetical protein [uncultured Chryseobacterium sp.]|nr:hypothetical protein [uncultured Chryseobacterium sp.]